MTTESDFTLIWPARDGAAPRRHNKSSQEVDKLIRRHALPRWGKHRNIQEVIDVRHFRRRLCVAGEGANEPQHWQPEELQSFLFAIGYFVNGILAVLANAQPFSCREIAALPNGTFDEVNFRSGIVGWIPSFSPLLLSSHAEAQSTLGGGGAMT